MSRLRVLRSAAIAAVVVACAAACAQGPSSTAARCSTFAAVVGLCGSDSTSASPAGGQEPTEDTTTSYPSYPSYPSYSGTTTTEPPNVAYQRLTGPRGISVEVPATWQDGAAAASYRQVGEADPAGAIARFGGYAPTKASLLAEITGGERSNPRIRAGYQRVSLSATTFQDVDAVDWQFTFVKDGVTRHVHGLYWRTGGTEYLIYLSAPEVEWSALEPVFDVMRDSVSTP